MLKRIKVLILASVAALALSAAAGASGASAAGIMFGSSPTTVSGTETLSHTFTFSGGRTYICSMPSFSAPGQNPTESLITTSGSSTTCSNSFEGPTTLKMNGCSWRYHPTQGAGTFDIGPAGCGPITMEGEYCTRSIGAQKGMSTTYSDQGSGSSAWVKAEDNAILSFTLTKGNLGLCSGSGTVSYQGSWKLATPSGAWLAAESAFRVTAKSGEPKFEGAAYPEDVLGIQDAAEPFVLALPGSRKVSCGEVETRAGLGEPSKSLTLDTDYRECTGVILGTSLPASIAPGTCDLGLNLLNVSSPFAATFDVACGNPEDGLVATVYSEAGSVVCTYKVSSQAGMSGVTFANRNAFTWVEAAFNVSGLAYQRTAGTLGNCGKTSGEATYTGTMNLHGVK